MTNVLYYGDNLAVSLESPPFNSNASYNVLFKARPGEGSQAQSAIMRGLPIGLGGRLPLA